MTKRIPRDKIIDPAKLEAWIKINTVVGSNPSPGAAFVYVEDLMDGFEGSRLEPDDLPANPPPSVPRIENGPYVFEATSDTVLREEWMTTLDPEKHRLSPPKQAE